MRDILDPADVWLGTPIGAEFFDNKRPVALDDALTVLKDSAPVTVDVLSNDFDPEGAVLTLISASAALGTAIAEADNTVTYTPPPGITGADTVVYEVADDLDQRRVAQINITITEPELTITIAPDNTLLVNAETGMIDITVTQPLAFAGTYQANTADLLTGPVNLVPPLVSGTVAAGQVLSATDGLWIYETNAGTPVQSWQWQRDGVDIAGETGTSYTVAAGDVGQDLRVVQTLTDTYGQRSAQSASAGFLPSSDTQLIAWHDASDAATITETAGAVSAWADKAGGAALTQTNVSRQPVTGTRTLNGRGVLDFVGGDFIGRAITLPASGDAAVHMVLAIDAVSNQYEAVLAFNATNDIQIDAGSNTQFDGRLNAAGIGTTTALTGGPFSGAVILSVIFDRTGAAEVDVFVSNTLRGTMTYTAPLDAAQTLYLMTNRSQNAWIDGAVAEVIVTADVSNRADYHAYLAGKWGL